jgi:hypothetical protein
VQHRRGLVAPAAEPTLRFAPESRIPISFARAAARASERPPAVKPGVRALSSSLPRKLDVPTGRIERGLGCATGVLPSTLGVSYPRYPHIAPNLSRREDLQRRRHPAARRTRTCTGRIQRELAIGRLRRNRRRRENLPRKLDHPDWMARRRRPAEQIRRARGQAQLRPRRSSSRLSFRCR